MSDPAAAAAARRAADGVPRAPPIDAVLFDLDGTIADTAPDLAAALNRVRADHGREPFPVERLRPFASHGARGMLGAGMDMQPEHPQFAAVRDAFLDYYETA